MNDSESKVIGYCAQFPNRDILCTEEGAYIVAGSIEAMQKHVLVSGDKLDEMAIKKVRFGEILKALNLGAEYGFDEESYKRFHPLAVQEHISVAQPVIFDEMDKDRNSPIDNRIVVVKM